MADFSGEESASSGKDAAVPSGRLNAGFAYRGRIPRLAPGTTVFEYLCAAYRHSSPETWLGRIEEKRVFLDGHPARLDDPATEGSILVWERPPWPEPVVPESFRILHEDAHLLAVEKPAGLPTMAGGGHLEHTLLSLVRGKYPDAAAVHRLGRWTSGVVLFARTGAARAHLARELREGKVTLRPSPVPAALSSSLLRHPPLPAAE